MGLYDQHVHTRFSVDSQAEPGEIVLRAVEQGLAGVTFTDHWDVHPAEWHNCVYDYQKLADIISRLRKQFGSQLFIGQGVEICYQFDQADRILDFLNTHSFDLVILSVHWFEGRALHVHEHWDQVDAAAATEKYLQAVLEAAQFVLKLAGQGLRPFHVLGHLDLVKRYTHRYFGTYDIRSYSDLVERILKACIQADLVMEINASSLRKSITETMPAEWVVQRYVELGGRDLTLGSDAHQSEHVGSRLDAAAEILRRQGITTQAVFKDSKRYREPL